MIQLGYLLCICGCIVGGIFLQISMLIDHNLFQQHWNKYVKFLNMTYNNVSLIQRLS